MWTSRKTYWTVSLRVQSAAKLSEHLRWFVSKNSYLMQVYEINICQVMTFLTLYCFYRAWDDKNSQSNQRKIGRIIASAGITLLPTVWDFKALHWMVEAVILIVGRKIIWAFAVVLAIFLNVKKLVWSSMLFIIIFFINSIETKVHDSTNNYSI